MPRPSSLPAIALSALLAAACGDLGPDGPEPLRDKIVFVAGRGVEITEFDLYVIPRTGGTPVRLTRTGTAGQPRVSKDGRTVLFVCGDDLCLIDSDGSHLRHLTESGCNSDPAWSPDESSIAFTSCRDGNREIYRMAADGSAETRLTDRASADLGPTWSPDGTSIVFQSDREPWTRSEAFALYVMTKDGADPRPFAQVNGIATWSHDGRHLAFIGTLGQGTQVFTMNSDGSGLAALIPNTAFDPAWSFDDQYLAVTELVGAASVISVVRADGTGVTRLTDPSVTSFEPSFSP